MGNFDSNYNNILCPYCEKNISKNKREGSWVKDLDDENFDFFQCQKCNKFFKVALNITTEYDYYVTKPTKEEIKKYGLIINKNKDTFEDCPGQIFIWKDLFSHKS